MSENKLKKSLTLTQMVAMAAGGMIAAWMVEIKFWFELSGSGSIFSLITCGILILPLCFIYTEMTSMLPYAGGQNVWISNAFSWNVGWFACWAILLLYIMAMPTVSYGIASMLGYLLPVSFMQVKVIATVIIFLWFFLTNMELKFIAKIQNGLFWSTLAVSLVADIIFIFSGKWSIDILTPMFPYGFEGFSSAVALLIMKFIGFDLIPQLSEEADFPKEKLGIAFIASIGLTVLIYGAAIIGVGGIVSQEWVMNIDIVDPRVADIIDMHWLGILIVVMGTGTCLTTLSGFWIAASRTLFGAAEQRQFTQKLTVLNKNGQPVLSNLIVGLLALFFTVFAPETWVNYIYTIYGLTAGVVYLMVTLSFMILRKKHPEWNRPYKAKYPRFFSIVSLLFTIFVIYTSALTMDLNAWFVLAIYAAIGTPLFLFAKRMQKKNPELWASIVINPDFLANKELNQ